MSQQPAPETRPGIPPKRLVEIREAYCLDTLVPEPRAGFFMARDLLKGYDELAARLSTVEAANARYESPETDLREGPWTQGKERQRQQLQLEHQQLKQQVVSLEGEVQLLVRERAKLVDDLLGPDNTSPESRLAKANSQVAELKQELAEQEVSKLALLNEIEAYKLIHQGIQTKWHAILRQVMAPLPDFDEALQSGKAMQRAGFTPDTPLINCEKGCEACAAPLEAAVPAAGPVIELRADRAGFQSPEYAARIAQVHADVESLERKTPNRKTRPYHIKSAAHARQIAHEVGYGKAKPIAPAAALPTTGEGKEVAGE